LLVVVFIIGIMAAMFTLSVGVAGGTDRELRREGERLQTVLKLALEDSNFQARDLGIRFYPKRYEFSVLDPGPLLVDQSDDKWALIEDDVFSSHELPPVFAFELEIEGKVVDIERSKKDVEKVYKPQLFIYSSGDFSDGFVIRIRSTEEDRSYSLDVALDGTVTLKKDHE
jgi:type II secretory pathway pseudopilin PulG